MTATKLESNEKRPNDKSPIYQRILATLGAHRNAPMGTAKAVTVIADSRILLQTYDRLLSEQGYKVLRLDRKTTRDPAIKAIIKHPNEYIIENQIDVLLMSPTVEMGFDINLENYFCKCFALFHGLLGTDSQMQFLRRIRHCADWAVWCAENNNQARQDWLWKSENQIQQQMLEHLLLSANKTFDDTDLNSVVESIKKSLNEAADDIHFRAVIDELIYLNYERANSKYCLIEALQGNTIKHAEQWQNKILNEAVRDTKEEIYKEDATAIFNSPVVCVDEAREIKKSFSSTVEENCSADKALLLDRLPGLDDSPLWLNPDTAIEFIASYEFKGKRDTVRSLERLWLYNNIDEARELSKAEWLKVCSSWNDRYNEPQNWGKLIDFRSFYGHDVRNDFVFIKAVRTIGILDLATGGGSYTAESDEIKKIIAKVKRSQNLQVALGVTPGKDAIKFIKAILEKFGCKSSTKKIKARGDERDSREYTFSLATDDENMAMLYRCIERKFAAKAENLELPKPEQFEPEALRVAGIPHYLEWLDHDECQWLEQGWKNATAANDETAKQFIITALQDYWNGDQGSSYRDSLVGWFPSHYSDEDQGVKTLSAKVSNNTEFYSDTPAPLHGDLAELINC